MFSNLMKTYNELVLSALEWQPLNPSYPFLCPLLWLGIWALCDFMRWTSLFSCWQDRVLGVLSSLWFAGAQNPWEGCWSPNRCWEVANRWPGLQGREGDFLCSASAHFHSGQVLSVGEICSQLINGKSVIPLQSLFMTISVFLWISSINHFQHFCHSSICPISEALCSEVSVVCDLLWVPNNEWKV